MLQQNQELIFLKKKRGEFFYKKRGWYRRWYYCAEPKMSEYVKTPPVFVMALTVYATPDV